MRFLCHVFSLISLATYDNCSNSVVAALVLSDANGIFHSVLRDNLHSEQLVTTSVEYTQEHPSAHHDGNSGTKTSTIDTASYLKRRRSDGYANEKYDTFFHCEFELLVHCGVHILPIY